MSNPIDDGGPAFPSEQGHIPDGTWNQTFERGLSLRDYFAAKALEGMLSNPQTADDSYDGASTMCYEYADAMLKARQPK